MIYFAGATIFENCEVLEVLLGDDGRVYAVKTTDGLVETKQFVDASGVVSIFLSFSLVKTL